MLDVAGHLTSFGWKGHGTALREGAITRPLLVSQKKSLSGLGKDRDEAFPFWDHVFSVAAKTIAIKIHADSDASDDDDASPESQKTSDFAITRTTTGIISNRRPTSALPTPGNSTPELTSDSSATAPTHKGSIMVIAKREAAKRALYARFYRGPVLVAKELPVNSDTTTRPMKRKRTNSASSSSDDEAAEIVDTRWKTLAAAVTAPAEVPATSAKSKEQEGDTAAKTAARAERKAARLQRRAARADKREQKRLRAERRAMAEAETQRPGDLRAGDAQLSATTQFVSVEGTAAPFEGAVLIMRRKDKKQHAAPILPDPAVTKNAEEEGEFVASGKRKKRRK